MTTVLLSAPYMLPYSERFRPVFDHYGITLVVADVNERLSEEEILRYAGTFDATICGDDRYTEAVIKQCLPRLKVISKWGTGIDSIDKAAANRLGVSVWNTPNAFTLPVSDTVLGYMLAFARQLPWLDQEVKQGGWGKFASRSLSECTLGVIGVGNVGKAVIRPARAFGMRLLGNDIVPVAPDFIVEMGLHMTSLETLLQEADFISVNCDLNPTSYHLINEKSLSLVKPSAVLINTARGPIVDEQALITALQEKRLGGAALDVYEVEPLPAHSPLRGFNNVMLASHNSNSSKAAWERVHWNTLRNLVLGLGLDASGLDAFIGKI
ncbi:MAG TPA: phosphoglycerate dehydrogenase [Anaerolineaceae bacterium]|nr:phosphoglycerate dehydrogenase [Anaerolineaceae bacterium]